MASKSDMMKPDAKKFPGAIENYKPDPDVVLKVEQKLLKIRVRLLTNEPFWGMLITRMILVDGSGWLGTAATDGRHFYYNVNFIQKLSDDELVFLFAHEVLHVVYDHFVRRNHRDPKLWNAAADFAINGELVEVKLGSMPKEGLIDKKFNKYDKNGDFVQTWHSEEIYEWLEANVDPNSNGEGLETLDVHLDPEDGKGGGGDGDEEGEGGSSSGTPGDANNAPTMTQQDLEDMKREMKNAMIQAAEQHNSTTGAGQLPAGIRRLIQEWTQPRVRWQNLLERNIKSQIKHDYSFNKWNRRGMIGGNIIMPAMVTEDMVKAYIAIDTSGSMSDGQLAEIMSELQGMMTQWHAYELHIWCFDGMVDESSYQVFTPDNCETIAEYRANRVYGGGGTDFLSNWAWMRDKDIRPDTFIMFTDGYPWGEWGEANYAKATIFCIHGDTNKQLLAPFGMTVWYEDGQAKRN